MKKGGFSLKELIDSLVIRTRDLTNLGKSSEFSLLTDKNAHDYNPERYGFYVQFIDAIQNPNLVENVLKIYNFSEQQRADIRSNIDTYVGDLKKWRQLLIDEKGWSPDKADEEIRATLGNLLLNNPITDKLKIVPPDRLDEAKDYLDSKQGFKTAFTAEKSIDELKEAYTKYKDIRAEIQKSTDSELKKKLEKTDETLKQLLLDKYRNYNTLFGLVDDLKKGDDVDGILKKIYENIFNVPVDESDKGYFNEIYTTELNRIIRNNIETDIARTIDALFKQKEVTKDNVLLSKYPENIKQEIVELVKVEKTNPSSMIVDAKPNLNDKINVLIDKFVKDFGSIVDKIQKELDDIEAKQKRYEGIETRIKEIDTEIVKSKSEADKAKVKMAEADTAQQAKIDKLTQEKNKLIAEAEPIIEAQIEGSKDRIQALTQELEEAKKIYPDIKLLFEPFITTIKAKQVFLETTLKELDSTLDKKD